MEVILVKLYRLIEVAHVTVRLMGGDCNALL